MSTLIVPETKIGALLDAYPAVEDSLIASVPVLERLRNPVLRRTVANATTLEQAARLGKVNLPNLITKLREAAGVKDDVASATPPGMPGWLRKECIRFEIDATSMLERGVHPAGKVRECAAALEPGEIIRLISPFRPAPLIELMARNGLAVHWMEPSPGAHETYFARPVTA